MPALDPSHRRPEEEERAPHAAERLDDPSGP
jgi:hypothetical protein